MATIGYAGLPVPGGGDAPVGPGQLADLATAIDPHLWQHADDQADRDSLYSAAPAQTVVVALDGTVWVKVSSVANTWITVWEPVPAWRTLSLNAAFEAGSTIPQVRRIGNQVFLRGRAERVDGQVIVGTNGIEIATVPDDCKPSQQATASAFYSLTGTPLIGAGRSEIYSDIDPNPAKLYFFSQDGAQDAGAVGCVWVDLSGSYWID